MTITRQQIFDAIRAMAQSDTKLHVRDAMYLFELMMSWEAVVPPSVNNDINDTAGLGRNFRSGDLWLDTIVGDMYMLTDETPGAAVWERIGDAGALAVEENGVSVNPLVYTLNFNGIGVEVIQDGTDPRKVNVFIPPPTYLSHWDTADGGNGDQSVTESITRTTARIATPNGGEGFPFKTGGWANTDQAASIDSPAVFTTPAATTGFGGDSTMTVTVYEADGITAMETYTTPAITGNSVHTSPSTNIIVTITLYGVDTYRFKANASISVDVDAICTASGYSGGRYSVEITHTTDSITDGSGPYTYNQTAVFFDANPSTPSISTSVSITETGGSVLTKHLSGVEYYILNSQFSTAVTDIDQLNRNTARETANLRLIGTEYGLPQLDQSPFGVGAANFAGWTSDDDQDGVDYAKTDWAITQTDYRYIGPTANITATPRDSWASGAPVASVDAPILVDTYLTSSTVYIEDFDDETYRQDSGFNAGAPAGNWTSTNSLAANEALVQTSQLMVPAQAAYPDLSLYKPDLGGANPDYSALVLPSNYYRTIDDSGSGLSVSSGQIVFTGTFVVDAKTDLVNQDLKIWVYKVAGLGNSGPPPGNTTPLLLHSGYYNFATFDDGVTDGKIMEGTSSGGTINFTFGGFNMQNGLYVHVQINNDAIKIDRMSFIFF